jgi:hypothetical protein
VVRPVVGAVAQNLGAVLVVVNSARLLRFESADAWPAPDATGTGVSATAASAQGGEGSP